MIKKKRLWGTLEDMGVIVAARQVVDWLTNRGGRAKERLQRKGGKSNREVGAPAGSQLLMPCSSQAVFQPPAPQVLFMLTLSTVPLITLTALLDVHKWQNLLISALQDRSFTKGLVLTLFFFLTCFWEYLYILKITTWHSFGLCKISFLCSYALPHYLTSETTQN